MIFIVAYITLTGQFVIRYNVHVTQMSILNLKNWICSGIPEQIQFSLLNNVKFLLKFLSQRMASYILELVSIARINIVRGSQLLKIAKVQEHWAYYW
jgi:hypothetical protein